MAELDTGNLKFSINRTPYTMLRMPASISTDGNGNELSRREERWIMQPYLAGSYTIDDGDAADILAHLRYIEKKKAELSEAESELSSVVLNIAENSRVSEVKKAQKHAERSDVLFAELRSADKDREIAAIVKRFLEEAK